MKTTRFNLLHLTSAILAGFFLAGTGVGSAIVATHNLVHLTVSTTAVNPACGGSCYNKMPAAACQDCCDEHCSVLTRTACYAGCKGE